MCLRFAALVWRTHLQFILVPEVYSFLENRNFRQRIKQKTEILFGISVFCYVLFGNIWFYPL